MTYIGGKVGAHLGRLAAWQVGEKPAPVTVEWDLSNRCVLGCQDCHFAHTHVKGPWASKPRTLPMAFDSTGDLAELALVERALFDMTMAGVLGVIWSGGGEPTTNPAWLTIMSQAKDCGLEQGIYTLGGLLTQASGRKLARLASWAVVSLDAPDGPTYAAEKGVSPERFDAACNGVRWLAEAGPAVVGVSFLLHENNWFRAPDMLRLSRTLGATYTTFRPAIRTSPAQPSLCTDDRAWVTRGYPTLEALAQEHDVEIDPTRFAAYRDWQGHGYASCEGPKLNTTITPDGRVWACPQKRGIASGYLGDLRTESFEAIWARHPGQFAVDADCRVMCRLHQVNQTLNALAPRGVHEAFV